MFHAVLHRLVGLCIRRPWQVVAVCVVLVAGAGTYTARNLSIDTDATKLLSPNLEWRKREVIFDGAFPQNIDLLAIVIDGATPELAESATARLAEKLTSRPDLFRTVRRPDGGPFFDKNGLLYLSVDEVRATTEQIVAAQPLIGPLSADPSLRGLFNALNTFLEGISLGRADIATLERPMTAIAAALEGAVDGKIAPPSWRAMFTGQEARPQEIRRFILAQPVLDFSSVTPGADASAAVRALAAEMKLDPEHGVRVRLTGPVALSDDEFGTLADGMGLSGILSFIGVGILLMLALGSFKLIAAILITLSAGLVLTAGFATLAVGSINLISIAFAVLFWGIAVDFGIQVSVAYRQARHDLGDSDRALVAALDSIGLALGLAGLTASVGFMSFLPTDYRGVSELGLIAGIGMLIALGLNITLLPALLKLFRPKGEAEGVGYKFLAPLDTFLLTRRRIVIGTALGLAIISGVACLRLEFDFNPINIKDKNTESVSTLFDLMKEPTTTPNTIDILAKSIDDAKMRAARLGELPEIAHAVSILSYVPDEQDAKLAYIEDARSLLASTFGLAPIADPPSDDAIVKALTRNRDLALQTGPQNPAAARLAAALDRIIKAPEAARVRAADALVPGLVATLSQLQKSLEAAPVTFEDLPPSLRDAWVAKDGRARIELFPNGNGNANDNDVLRQFVRAVRALEPDATGTPVSIQESSRTIVNAFVTAGILALAAISVLLLLVLKSLRDTAVVIAPLILAGLLTLGTCVIVGLPLNFANIIALPLLFGIGVAFNIYYVMAWRRGQDHLLQSSITRAIIFSAGATASAFGSLAVSSHPGTADMGILLSMSLGYTLLTALGLLPSLLGPARLADQRPAFNQR